MKTIKVVVIDTKTKTVYEKEIEPKLQAFYATIGCSIIEAVYPQGMAKHLLYVDEEGLYNGWETGFRIMGWHGVIHGSAIVLGTDGKGNDRDCRFDAASIEDSIQFVDLQKS